jgi:hypothetical protein
LSRGTGCYGDAKELIESVGDFPVGHAGTLIEVNNGRLCVAAELALSGTGGVAGLQGMSAAQMLAAFIAVAAVDFELAENGLAWNLGLELSIEMILDNIAPAIGTLLGQSRIECFIDLFGGRKFAMGVFAVLVARLAACLFGILLRFSLRKWSGLTLGGPFAFLEAFL